MAEKGISGQEAPRRFEVNHSVIQCLQKGLWAAGSVLKSGHVQDAIESSGIVGFNF